jgi:alpha-D-ribose 1-methylphosphonate 5-triphosphate synthase subunit PhnG
MTIATTDQGLDKSPDQFAPRRAAMRLLVEAETEELATLLAGLGGLPAHENVRAPETGLVMVRGRIGGDGSPFNVGEATVSRATVRLESGEMGFGYVLGRDREKARLVALCDVLSRCSRYSAVLEDKVLAPLRRRIDADRQQVAERTAATRVDFFALVRGDG